MLEWLQGILGDGYSEDIDKKISAEVGRNFVSKTDFNAVKEEMKNLKRELDDKDAELDGARKNAESADSLEKKLLEKDKKIEQMEKQLGTANKTAAVKEALRALGVSEPDYIIYKQGGIDSFSFDENGEPVSIADIADTYRKSPSGALLFSAAGYSPAGGFAEDNPFAKETFNLTQQAKLLRENPAEARRMAAAAQVKI